MMRSAFSKTSVWINTMSTSDPGSRDPGSRDRGTRDPVASDLVRSSPGTVERVAVADQGSAALPDDGSSAAMFALPDPAVIARLANEFFAALPVNVPAPDNVGASVPARATTGALPAASSLPTSSPAGVTPLTPALPNVPSSPAAPGSMAYVFDRTSPLNASPSLPSLNEAFAFPAVPGAQAMPGIPEMPASAPGATLTEADLRAIPASLGNVPLFAPGIPSSSWPPAA